MTEIEGRYTDHKLFLSTYISENITPNGLKRKLEPTIENHNTNFLSNLYDKLQQYLLVFMKEIVTFCNKTITNVKAETENTEKNLKINIKYKTFSEVQNPINFN